MPSLGGGGGAGGGDGSGGGSLPNQTGNAGKVLGTNGTLASWVAGGGGGAAFAPVVFNKIESTIDIVSLSGTAHVADGFSIIAGDVILLRAQSDSKFNGLWTVNAGAWTRPTGFATGVDARDVFARCNSDDVLPVYINTLWMFRNATFPQITGLTAIVDTNPLQPERFTLASSPASPLAVADHLVEGNVLFSPSSVGNRTINPVAATVGVTGNRVTVTGGAGFGDGVSSSSAAGGVFLAGGIGGVNDAAGSVGAAGVVSLTGGAGRSSTNTNASGVGGQLTETGGAGGAGTATAAGGGGGAVLATGGLGGTNLGAGGGTGGSVPRIGGAGAAGSTSSIARAGGSAAATGGAGGSGTSLTPGATGGSASLTGGQGGANVSAGGGGLGGAVNATGGAGRTGSGASVGSAGGAVTATGGAGGSSGSTSTGGAGGATTVRGGDGGGSNGVTQTAGPGGLLTLRGGAGGSVSGGTGALGGNVLVDGGTGTLSPGFVGGTVNIGTVTAEDVNIGRTGKIVNMLGQANFPSGMFSELRPSADSALAFSLGTTSFRWNKAHIGIDGIQSDGIFSTVFGPFAIPSGGTVVFTHNFHHVSGVALISTLTPPTTGGGANPLFRGKVTVIPDGAFTWDTAGNIALAGTAIVNRALDFVYDGTSWYPSYV